MSIEFELKPDEDGCPRATQDFMVYCFKVAMCSKKYRHDWKQCPFTHNNESARRRDPRTHSYSAAMCEVARKGKRCPVGDSCPRSHNMFESWLHPARFRTEICSKRDTCKRPFCFFAHRASDLRKIGGGIDDALCVSSSEASDIIQATIAFDRTQVVIDQQSQQPFWPALTNDCLGLENTMIPSEESGDDIFPSQEILRSLANSCLQAQVAAEQIETNGGSALWRG